jgi:mannose-6-phosphate isomerase-like protein (cupin superfamily)
MPEPVIAQPGEALRATGASFALHEWAHGPGGGPPLHIHHEDDEAWYVLEGALQFRFADRTIDLMAGGAVFVPRGVAHTFAAGPGGARYLIITTRRVLDLIAALHDGRTTPEPEIYREFASEIVE